MTLYKIHHILFESRFVLFFIFILRVLLKSLRSFVLLTQKKIEIGVESEWWTLLYIFSTVPLSSLFCDYLKEYILF